MTVILSRESAGLRSLRSGARLLLPGTPIERTHLSDDSARILVLGIGNILMMDEGVGNRIATDLEANYRFPEDVRIVDAGTMGLGMIHLFRGVEFALVVDAIDGSGHPAGTVVRVSPEDFAPNQVMHSLHDVRFVDVLNAARLIDVTPEAECVGVQVENMSPPQLTIGLTATLEAAVPRAIAAVLFILEERGVVADGLEESDAVLLAAVSEAKSDIARRAGS